MSWFIDCITAPLFDSAPATLIDAVPSLSEKREQMTVGKAEDDGRTHNRDTAKDNVPICSWICMVTELICALALYSLQVRSISTNKPAEEEHDLFFAVTPTLSLRAWTAQALSRESWSIPCHSSSLTSGQRLSEYIHEAHHTWSQLYLQLPFRLLLSSFNIYGEQRQNRTAEDAADNGDYSPLSCLSTCLCSCLKFCLQDFAISCGDGSFPKRRSFRPILALRFYWRFCLFLSSIIIFFLFLFLFLFLFTVRFCFPFSSSSFRPVCYEKDTFRCNNSRGWKKSHNVPKRQFQKIREMTLFVFLLVCIWLGLFSILRASFFAPCFGVQFVVQLDNLLRVNDGRLD